MTLLSLTTLLQAAQPQATQGGNYSFLIMMLLIFVVMYAIKCIKERIEKKIFEIYFNKYMKHEDD